MLCCLTSPRLQHRYWCLSPRPPELLNTFVERPAIDTRLMYWLAALHGIDGMLYYAVNLWYNQCDVNHMNRPCKPMERIRNTAMTDFNPAMCKCSRSLCVSLFQA